MTIFVLNFGGQLVHLDMATRFWTSSPGRPGFDPRTPLGMYAHVTDFSILKIGSWTICNFCIFTSSIFSHWYPFFTPLFAKGVTSIQLWLAFTLNYGNGCSSVPLVKLFTPLLHAERVSKHKLYQFINFVFVSYFYTLLTKIHCPQCAILRIFLSFRFYVKSIFGESRNYKTAVFAFFEGPSFVNLPNFSLKKVQKS